MLGLHLLTQTSNVAAFLASIEVYNSLRERHYLCRNAIRRPAFSPWTQLYKAADDGSFLHMTGFNRESFEKLKRILFGRQLRPRNNGGRPRNLDDSARLGLYLFYVGSTMSVKWLCLHFGVVESTARECITEMRKLICRKLRSQRHAAVRWPTDQENEEWAALVQIREPYF